MGYDPREHHRRSVRLAGYDYVAGIYFVTLCTHGHACLFGDVVDCVLRPSAAGRMVEAVWRDLPTHVRGLATDALVVMPNHLHGILLTTPESPRLGDIVGRFKSFTTAEYGRRVRSGEWPPYEARLWQRNYFECVIRHDQAMARIQDYIAGNPGMWSRDKENPDCHRPS